MACRTASFGITVYCEVPGARASNLCRQLTRAAPVWEAPEGESTAVTTAPRAVVSPVFLTMTTTSSCAVAATTETEPAGGIWRVVVTPGSVDVVVVDAGREFAGVDDPTVPGLVVVVDEVVVVA